MNEENKTILLYPEITYEIIGAAFDTFNELGPGCQEKHYQKGMVVCFDNRGLAYKQQVHCPLECFGKRVGDYFMDFVVEGKIVVELKIGSRFLKRDFEQIKEYLQKSGLELGLLIRFYEDGVSYKRILKPYP